MKQKLNNILPAGQNVPIYDMNVFRHPERKLNLQRIIESHL